MFNKNIDDRLSSWAELRAQLEKSENPLKDTWEFWKNTPFIPYNNKIDPFHQRSWPSPWEIIVDNKYDDFTKALMIGWTLKLTNRFQNDLIEIKTLVDKKRTAYYNIVYVNNEWVINYSDNGPTSAKDIPDSFSIENLIELTGHR
jgi:hypothetical protein